MLENNRPKDKEKITIIENFLKENNDISKTHRQGW
jgi:hypothetical protein